MKEQATMDIPPWDRKYAGTLGIGLSGIKGVRRLFSLSPLCVCFICLLICKVIFWFLYSFITSACSWLHSGLP